MITRKHMNVLVHSTIFGERWVWDRLFVVGVIVEGANGIIGWRVVQLSRAYSNHFTLETNSLKDRRAPVVVMGDVQESLTAAL